MNRLMAFCDACGRRPRITIAALTVACVVAYVGGTAVSSGPGGALVQGDADSYFAYLPSLVLDRDIDLRNQFVVIAPKNNSTPTPWGVGVDGRAANPFPIAAALVWLPGYVVGLGIDWMTDGLGTGQTLGYGPGAVWGAASMTIFAVGLGVFLCFSVVSRFVTPTTALVVSIAVWAGTPLLYYTIVSPLYSHGVGWAVAAAFIALLPLGRDRGAGRWFIAGIAGGFMVAVRLQDVPLLVTALVALYVAQRAGSMDVARFAALVGGGLLGYLPQGLTWYRIYGTIIPIEPHAQTGEFSVGKLLSVLTSSGYGWWSWSPLVLLGLAGLGRIRKITNDEIRALAIAGLMATAGLTWLDVVHPYGAGSTFGGRRYISLGIFLAIGIAMWAVRVSAKAPPADSDLSPGLFAATIFLTLYGVWVFTAYELLVLRRGIYGGLFEVWRYGLGLGPPG